MPARTKPKAAARAKVPAFEAEVALSLALDARFSEWQQRGQLAFYLPVQGWAPVLAAAAAAVETTDFIFPSAREARLALFRGLPLAEYLLQHLGLAAPDADPLHSQAGHALPGTVGSSAHRVASPASSAGGHLPQAVGAAFAAKLLKRPEAVLALAGPGASDSADCHVALNFAGIYRAPVVFLFRADQSTPEGAMVKRASGYGIPAEQHSGSEPAALRARLQALLAAARAGHGPALVEVLPPDDSALAVSPAALAAARVACDAAFATAQAGRRPGLSSVTAGVFAEPSWPLVEQARDLAGEVVLSPEEL